MFSLLDTFVISESFTTSVITTFMYTFQINILSKFVLYLTFHSKTECFGLDITFDFLQRSMHWSPGGWEKGPIRRKDLADYLEVTGPRLLEGSSYENVVTKVQIWAFLNTLLPAHCGILPLQALCLSHRIAPVPKTDSCVLYFQLPKLRAGPFFLLSCFK